MNPDGTHHHEDHISGGVSSSCAQQPPPNRNSSNDDAFFNLDSIFLDIPFENELPTDDELKETLKCLDSHSLDMFHPVPDLDNHMSLGSKQSLYWLDPGARISEENLGWACGDGRGHQAFLDSLIVGTQNFDHPSPSPSPSRHQRGSTSSHKHLLKTNSHSMKKTFRGVSKHRLTQRWEASLWLNGKQLYLGGFNVQEDAARAYDLAALACKGSKASTNFRPIEYERQLQELQNHSEEEVVAYIRRRSTAFSRGRSKYRGVSGQEGRWEARIGSFKGRKNVSFGVFETEEEAARQYDRALIVEKGRSAKTNFPLQEYDKEVLEYWHLKSLCTSDEEEKRLVESYTLPIGRTVSSEEFKRGIVITGEALTGRTLVVKRPETLVSLKTTCSLAKNVDLDRIALTHKGSAIESDDDVCQLKDGDVVLYFVRPRKAPIVAEQDNEEEEDDLALLDRDVDSLFVIRKGSIPEYARSFLLDMVRIPEWVVAPLTHMTKRQAFWFVSWCSMSRVCYRFDLGPIFILGTVFYVMFSNLGTRTGEFSAYSIFNRGVRRLPGDRLDADHIRRTGFA